MNYIVTHEIGDDTMEEIGKHIENCTILMKRIKTDGRWYKVNQNEWTQVTLPEFTSQDYIVRWGYCGSLDTNHAKAYQHIDSIIQASDKGSCRMLLQSLGISVPRSSTKPDYMNFPLIHRPNHHHRCSGLTIVNNIGECDVLSGGYYAEVFPKVRELRVHVTHGKVLMIEEKPITPTEVEPNQDDWTVLRWRDYDYKVCKLSVNAVKAIGADFGGVDILIDEHNNCVVCEINTAPAASTPYPAKKYTKYLTWLFGQKRKWFDYTQWDSADGFVFREMEL